MLTHLRTTAAGLRQDGEGALAELVERFYGDRGYHLAWADAPALAAADELLARIAASHEDGLCPLRYGLPRLRDRLAVNGGVAGRHDPALDVDLSTSLLRYVLHLGLGHPAAADRAQWSRPLDVMATFRALRRPEAVPGALQALAPSHAEYRRLRGALDALRGIVLRGGWPSVATDLFLRPGDVAPDAQVLETLADRLRSSGDLGADVPRDGRRRAYDGALVEGVRRFQRRHGLAVDGIVGPRTVAALNVPAFERLRQIEINMDRWRRVPDDLGATHVRVNIPEFRVRLFEGGGSVLGMRAIVGRPAAQTPVFSDRIRYLVFNPRWNVPDGIVRREIAPAAAADPAYLREHAFEVLSGWEDEPEAVDPSIVDWEAEHFDLRLRQRPGPENALGRVKFMFPNRHSVYLHDTPAKRLFQRSRRALSHGCVRVARPERLATALLSGTDDWPAERVSEAIGSGDRVAVPLKAPVPVHLLYFTAWVEADGAVHFREDVYRRDAAAGSRLRCRAAASHVGAADTVGVEEQGS